MRKNNIFLTGFIIVFFIHCFSIGFVYGMDDEEPIDEAMLKDFIQKAYDTKCKCMIEGDWKELKQYYDTTKKYAQWSYEHEAKRIKYLVDWSSKRNAGFTDIRSIIDLKRVKKRDGIYLLSVTEVLQFDYAYNDDIDEQKNSFEVTLQHSIGLINKDKRWFISRDWYTDCFLNALGPYSGIYIGKNDDEFLEKLKVVKAVNLGGVKYDRQKAVQYADKYYSKYNSKYKDCNGIGGDCTNYVSQCISDKEEGGGIAFDRIWFCVYPKHGGRAEGSKAFVNTDAFKGYLVYSGRGRVLRRGDFEEVTKKSDDYPIGAAGLLQIGDLICYEVKGQIDHFSIITAKDSKGYPMINSHTVERYHVPFDLGWGGKNIKFHLIKIVF